ncbi:MAG: NADP-dependent oxidoreductase [Pseudomonadales bacterium]|nr:NADP-dependent oxidoreductase [Pseudomonadales bacterium]MBO6565851.1 NADP-dependent oxidoreductase [Pseudomonadales bacterium]MBO6594460.1 NADP-dependent oxidoreductase [Pseudomonadales bacterium]MBO6700963.1 NADP-dependent oxidoreductase [Pseudomonadales bacterium]MBO6821979.1 NADP-dependent oxidoreductase [Pseudomonadales bacterium]
MSNTQVVLARRPKGRPLPEDFEVVQTEVPEPGEGEALMQNLFVSLDAGFRNWMDEGAGDEVLPAMEIGAPVMGLVAGKVLKSNRDDMQEGQVLVGRLAWEAYSIATAADLMVPIEDKFDQPANLFLGLLGDTGLSAYFGLTRVAHLQPGETVVISAAGGAVGNAAGQIAKAMGAGKVVGFAGSADKCRWLEDEVGYDATINYREDNVDEALASVCPDGIDVYFDNVGGDLLEPVLNHINYQARIPFCGAVADYADEDGTGPKNLFRLVANCARLEGFMTHYWVEDYEAARDVLVGWLNEGKLKNFEASYDGVENCGVAFSDLFAGKNFGKAIVKV